MSNFIIGFIIGITSLIPGISSGTIIYILNKDFYSILYNYKNNKFNILLILIGIILGIILIANILEFLFINHYTIIQLIICFILLINILFMLNTKFNIIYFILGIIIILFLNSFNLCTYNTLSNINVILVLSFAFYGFIDGFFTIIPGISGSMILMIIGPYYLLKSYIANITISNLIPIIIYYLFDLFGIYNGSKFLYYFNKKNNTIFNSIILGLIFGSIIYLLPI